jgi:hypothetical protein
MDQQKHNRQMDMLTAFLAGMTFTLMLGMLLAEATA